jgi:hypothetical protein
LPKLLNRDEDAEVAAGACEVLLSIIEQRPLSEGLRTDLKAVVRSRKRSFEGRRSRERRLNEVYNDVFFEIKQHPDNVEDKYKEKSAIWIVAENYRYDHYRYEGRKQKLLPATVYTYYRKAIQLCLTRREVGPGPSSRKILGPRRQ